MSTWLVVPQDLVADDPELADWVELALRGGRATPATRKKSSRSPATRPAPAKKKAPKPKTLARKAKPRRR